MDGRRVGWVAVQDSFEQFDRPIELRRDIVERGRDHPRIGGDRRDLVIVGVFVGQLIHRAGKGDVACTQAAAMNVTQL